MHESETGKTPAAEDPWAEQRFYRRCHMNLRALLNAVTAELQAAPAPRESIVDAAFRCSDGWKTAQQRNGRVRVRVGRAYVCALTLLSVLAPAIRTHARGGETMMTDLSFIEWDALTKGLEFTPLSSAREMLPLEIEGCMETPWWKVLLVGTASDFAHAMRALTKAAPGAARESGIEEDIARLFEALGLGEASAGVSPHDLELKISAEVEPYDEFLRRDEVRQSFGLFDFELEFLVDRRMILSVPSWDGEELFPPIQFLTPTNKKAPNQPGYWFLRRDVVNVLQNTPRQFGGWKALSWFAHNGLSLAPGQPGPGAGSFAHRIEEDHSVLWEAKLAEIGLWVPHWISPPEGRSDEFEPSACAEVPKTLFRVTPRRKQNGRGSHVENPFWFTAAPVPNPELISQFPQNVAARRIELQNPSGRFDPLHRTGEIGIGAVYFAEDAVGCWTEMLDREPAVFLDDVLARKHWQVEVSKVNGAIADLTTLPVYLSTNQYRSETQSLATRLVERAVASVPGSAEPATRCVGLRYNLRSRGASTGVVLFDTFTPVTGASPPQGPPPISTTDPRVLDTVMPPTAFEVHESAAAWETLWGISQERTGHSVTFRRFPAAIPDASVAWERVNHILICHEGVLAMPESSSLREHEADDMITGALRELAKRLPANVKHITILKMDHPMGEIGSLGVHVGDIDRCPTGVIPVSLASRQALYNRETLKALLEGLSAVAEDTLLISTNQGWELELASAMGLETICIESASRRYTSHLRDLDQVLKST